MLLEDTFRRGPAAGISYMKSRTSPNAMWQRLLAFCSDKTPNQGQTRRRTTCYERRGAGGG